MTAFGKKILAKYGWADGKGLGKEEQGIARPVIAVTQKTTEGVGYQSSLFEPWWDGLYDKVANKVAVGREVKSEKEKKSKKKKKAKSEVENEGAESSENQKKRGKDSQKEDIKRSKRSLESEQGNIDESESRQKKEKRKKTSSKD